MTLRAVMRTGESVPLDAGQGATEDELVDRLTRDTLTGSAAPLADATLRAADGREIRYADVNCFESD